MHNEVKQLLIQTIPNIAAAIEAGVIPEREALVYAIKYIIWDRIHNKQSGELRADIIPELAEKYNISEHTAWSYLSRESRVQLVVEWSFRKDQKGYYFQSTNQKLRGGGVIRVDKEKTKKLLRYGSSFELTYLYANGKSEIYLCSGTTLVPHEIFNPAEWLTF